MLATPDRASPSRVGTRKTWEPWIPAILWLGVIALESTDLASSEHTGYLLYSLLHPLFPHIDPISWLVWNHLLRKVGHVLGYAILSFLLFRAWRATLPVGHLTRWAWRWASTAWFMTILVASLDEWHQTFIPSRTGRISDVILDSSAALGVQVLIFLLVRLSSFATLPTDMYG